MKRSAQDLPDIKVPLTNYEKLLPKIFKKSSKIFSHETLTTTTKNNITKSMNSQPKKLTASQPFQRTSIDRKNGSLHFARKNAPS